jgi:hypothetical protein
MGGIQLRILFVLLISAVLAVLTGLFIAQGAQSTAILLIVGIGFAFFFFSSYRWWWTIIPASFASGALLYYGFKLYLHEIALLVCAATLPFAGAMSRAAIRQQREPLPKIFYFLGGYLVLHMLWSLLTAQLSGEGGINNILRHYMGGLWGIIFVLLFHFFGSSRYLKRALFFLFLAYAFRVSFTLFTYYVPSFNYVPVINLVLPGSTMAEIDDLRWGAPGLASVAICYMCISRSISLRFLNMLIFIGASIALLLGGGRVAAATLLGLPLAVALIQKRFKLLTLLASLTICGLAWLNLSPRSIETLPIRMQRTLGIFILERGAVSAHTETELSDLWHERLREVATDRWLDSPRSILVGNTIKKFDYGFYWSSGFHEFDTEARISQASDLGAYETGWFSVLAITGLIGLALFCAAMFTFMKNAFLQLWREGLKDHRTAFSFLTLYSIAIWAVLGWTVGGYPSYELMLGAIAYGSFADSRKVSAENPPQAASDGWALGKRTNGFENGRLLTPR